MRASVRLLWGQCSLLWPCCLLTLGAAEIPSADATGTRSPRPLGSCRRPHPPCAEPGSLAASAGPDCGLWLGAGCRFSLLSPPLTPLCPPWGQDGDFSFLVLERSHLPSVSDRELLSILQNRFPVPRSLVFWKKKVKKIPTPGFWSQNPHFNHEALLFLLFSGSM